MNFKSTDKEKQEADYLEKHLFCGLKNLNDGFDAHIIYQKISLKFYFIYFLKSYFHKPHSFLIFHLMNP